MRRLVTIALVGLVAQLIDGSLGMAYGATSATLLLSIGLAPALASASVHLAEVATTFVSGFAHWKLGNVDWRTVRWLAVPGAGGAFAGALVLGVAPADRARPFVAVLLFGLGVVILLRFARRRTIPVASGPVPARNLAGLGVVAGFLDAVGGGGWGPVSTPALVASGRMRPRHVVGSVDTSEFLVSVAASAGFLLSLGRAGIYAPIVLALLCGGVVAAPVAALLVRVLHPRLLGTLVGATIVLTNARTILGTFGIEPPLTTIAYGVVLAASSVATGLGIVRIRRERILAEATAG